MAGHPEPNEKKLAEEIERLDSAGMPGLDLGVLLALAEALFRPMKAFELALEALLPDFFSSRSEDGSLSAAAEELLRMDFSQRYKMKSREIGDAWVLAAGEVSLSVGGRPPMVAPKVIGATVAVRLHREGLQEVQAAEAAARLIDGLMDSPVRAEEIQHWRRLYYQVKVPSDDGREIPLTRYLAYPFQVPGDSLQHIKDRITYGIPLTPSDFLNAWVLPPSTSVDVARLVSQVERKRRVEREESAQKKSPRKGSPLSYEAKDMTANPEQAAFATLVRFTCRICGKKDMTVNQIWSHLEKDHDVPEEVLDIPERLSSKEIHRKDTGQLLATWQEIRPR